MNAYSRPLLATGIGLLAVVATAACSSHTEPAPRDDGPAIEVQSATVAMRDVGSMFDAGGVVQARMTAVLSARIVAPVREVRVVPGDRVRAGQVLVVLDGGSLGAQARGARAGAHAATKGAAAAVADEQAAQAALVLARATHQRIASLHAKRSATPQELDQAVAALRSAEASADSAAARAQQAASGIEGAQAASEAAGATEAYTRITAPFDGVITEKTVEPGNMASPGMALLRVEDTRGFRLDVRVDESRIGQMAIGARVPVVLADASGAATTVTGSVSEIARAVESDARAFLVKIALPDAASLRSGMFGRARFAGAPRLALAVPAGALVLRGQVTSVFVIDHGVARLRLVDVRDTEVLAGLSEGEVVVVDPVAAIVDGRRVREGGR